MLNILIPLMLTEPISNDARLGFPYLLPPCYEIHYQINMHLVADGS